MESSSSIKYLGIQYQFFLTIIKAFSKQEKAYHNPSPKRSKPIEHVTSMILIFFRIDKLTSTYIFAFFRIDKVTSTSMFSVFRIAEETSIFFQYFSLYRTSYKNISAQVSVASLLNMSTGVSWQKHIGSCVCWSLYQVHLPALHDSISSVGCEIWKDVWQWVV